jgi:hypothetical protein
MMIVSSRCLFPALLSLWRSLPDVNAFGIIPTTHHATKPFSCTALWYSGETNEPPLQQQKIPQITSPVLQQVYPALLEYKQQYGHPNIPLGSAAGRQCKTLQRLHIQTKLTDEEVAWLKELGFVFHSLEEVYQDVDFDQLLARLLEYEKAHPDNNFQVPKKCPEDPELGAWVTGIRRLGKEGVQREHVAKLDAADFAWKSIRKCGSKFMEQYRGIKVDVANRGAETVLKEAKTQQWIFAQQEVFKKGSLSPTRCHYLEELVGAVLKEGEEWTSFGRD